MPWLEDQIQTVTTKGEGSTQNVNDTTTVTKSGGPQVTTTRTPSVIETTARGAKVNSKTTTQTPQTSSGTDSKASTVQVIEDEGFHVEFKIKIRSGLTAGTSYAPLCPT
jgi:hypothetical protein